MDMDNSGQVVVCEGTQMRLCPAVLAGTCSSFLLFLSFFSSFNFAFDFGLRWFGFTFG